MNIVLGSLFRNSAGRHIGLYFDRVRALQDALPAGDTLRLALVEGDSVDNTASLLRVFANGLDIPLDLVTRNHGGPVYGSTEEVARMTALSQVGNGFLEAVQDTDDVAIYVESDLIWAPDTMLRLAQQLQSGVVDVVSPLVFAGAAFYDIWAFRKSGVRFGPFHPYHHELVFDGLTEVDSTGSCLVMRAAVARAVRMSDGALVEFCNNARSRGYRVWVDARERIGHPA